MPMAKVTGENEVWRKLGTEQDHAASSAGGA